MDALLEEVVRIFIALALYVLRQGDDGGAAVCGIGQHAHRVDHCAHHLLRARNAVPVTRDRLEAVGCGHGQVVRYLELLEHRVRLTGCKRVRREQQQRQVVDRRGERCGYHVRCANTDRGRARDDLAAVVLLGIRDRCVRHALLVAALINTQVARILLQRLAKAHYHAVAEDREDAVHERFYLAVHLDVLLVQELDDRLTYCHFGFTHFSSSLTRVYSHSLAALSAAFVFDGFSVARPAQNFLLTSWRLARTARFSLYVPSPLLFCRFFTTFSTFEPRFPAFRPIRCFTKSCADFSNIPLFCILSCPAPGGHTVRGTGLPLPGFAAARRTVLFSAAERPPFSTLPQDFHKNRTGARLLCGSGCTRPAHAFSLYCAVFSAPQTVVPRVLAFPCETAPNAGN